MLDLQTLYNIKTYPHCSSLHKALFLNQLQIALFDFSIDQTITLEIGVNRFLVSIQLQNFDISTSTIYCSKSMLDDLPYEINHSLNLIFVSNSRLVLGSVFGLAISKKSWENIENQPSIQKKALLAQTKGIIFCCLYLPAINLSNYLVPAYFFNSSISKWVVKEVPLPHIVHYRGRYPNASIHKISKNLEKKTHFQWLNSVMAFGKWETYQAMQSYNGTAHYMPYTLLFNRINLEHMLKEYNFCYIKNNRGRCGKGIFRIEHRCENYICKTGGSEINTWHFSTFQALSTFLEEIFAKKSIIQQEISLETIDNCPFDMRVLMQKDEYAKWTLSALNFRIANTGAIVTNFSAGARDAMIIPKQPLLHPNISWETITHFATHSVAALESYFGPLGEIGLDIALDKNGRLWLIEANSRPSTIAYRNASTEVMNKILGLPLDYSVTLMKKLNNQRSPLI